MKEDYDGAEPAPSSVSVMNLLALGHLIDRPAWASKVERTLARFGPGAGEFARQLPLMLSGLAAWHAGMQQIVVVGDPQADDTAALRTVIARWYLPFAVMVPVHPGATQAALAERLPWVGDLAMREGRATAYVCRNFACDLPVTAPEALDDLLAGIAGSGASRDR
jgi:uncharacterized protein YyaL (SSP411 family)